jgi:hypothetical protein
LRPATQSLTLERLNRVGSPASGIAAPRGSIVIAGHRGRGRNGIDVARAVPLPLIGRRLDRAFEPAPDADGATVAMEDDPKMDFPMGAT